jgi:hypothetical protein
MQEPEQSPAAVHPDAMKGLIGRTADGDVVRVPRHSVGTEREHNIRSFVTEKTGDTRDKILERHLVKLSVGVLQPVVPSREVAHRTPGTLILVPAEGPQSLSRRGSAWCDLTSLTIGGVQEAEPKPRVISVQGN